MTSVAPFPFVTGPQMAAVDAAMVEVCGLELVQVMETAGRAVAIVARQMLRSMMVDGPIAILCGSGGNGGDGFVCGRYLAGWGFDVECWLVRPAGEYRGLAAHQLDVSRRIGLTLHEPGQISELRKAALIIDGLFGFGLNAAPSGRAAQLIGAANAAPAPILAIDIPSGIDATIGRVFDPAIRAQCTVTLGLPKQGLVHGAGRANSGVVVVADIGIPPAAYEAVGIPLTDNFREVEFAALDGTPVDFELLDQ